MAIGLDGWAALRLAALGFGTFTAPIGAAGDTIFVGEEPPSPAEAVTVILEGGGAPQSTVGMAVGFTIRTRAATYERAQEVSANISKAMHEEQGLFSGVAVGIATANTGPVPLGRDSSGAQGGRFVFSQSFSTISKRFTL